MAGTAVGLRAVEYMNLGELVPDDVVIAVVADRLAQDQAAGGFVLDGFPRTRRQAEELHRVLLPSALDTVISIDVATPVVVRRLSGRRVCQSCGAIYHVDRPPTTNWTCDADGGAVVQRPDDDEPAVLRRLQLYEEEIGPVMTYYAELGILGVISGVGTAEEVSDRIIGLIDARSAPSGLPRVTQRFER